MMLEKTKVIRIYKIIFNNNSNNRHLYYYLRIDFCPLSFHVKSHSG